MGLLLVILTLDTLIEEIYYHVYIQVASDILIKLAHYTCTYGLSRNVLFNASSTLVPAFGLQVIGPLKISLLINLYLYAYILQS